MLVGPYCLLPSCWASCRYRHSDRLTGLRLGGLPDGPGLCGQRLSR